MSLKSKWLNKYMLLKEYVEQTGKFPIHDTVINNEKIGSWLTNQRISYKRGTLTSEQIQTLESLEGFQWSLRDRTDWEYGFSVYKSYMELNDEQPSISAYLKGFHIGLWCHFQRIQYRNKTMKAERIHKLNEVNFCWSLQDAQWDSNFELLKSFLSEFNRLPKGKDVYHAVPIGEWFIYQRRLIRKGMLIVERLEKLLSLKAKVAVPVGVRKRESIYQATIAYIKKYKKVPNTCIKSPEGYYIGRWYTSQIKQYTENPENYKYREQIEHLQKIITETI